MRQLPDGSWFGPGEYAGRFEGKELWLCESCLEDVEGDAEKWLAEKKKLTQ